MPAKKLLEPPKYHHGDLRRSVMNGALELARSSGIETLSLREVARKIGVSTAAPYHHFKDRQSLLMDLAIEGYQKLLETMRRACAAAPDPRHEIQAAALAYLHFGREHRAEYAIMFAGEYGGHPRAAEMMAVADACLDLVRAPIARFTNLDPEQAAEAAFAAWSLLHGILQLDQKGILRESAAEQDRLAVKGVLSIVNGF
jgi:AcrR family transcriptional regulator